MLEPALAQRRAGRGRSGSRGPGPRRGRAASALAVAIVSVALIAAAAPVARGESAGPASIVPEAPHEGEPGSLELDELMRRMAATRGVRARFREVKELALLREPLVSEGEIVFAPPRRFARLTTSPGRSAFVVDGARLRFEDETGVRALDLSANRIVRAVVESFVSVFTGDLPVMRERYEIAFRAEGARWSLLLRPRDAAVAALIESVALRGDGPVLVDLVVREAGGDRATTTFRDAVVDEPVDEATLRRVFGEVAVP